jgi:hypothetical protein
MRRRNAIALLAVAALLLLALAWSNRAGRATGRSDTAARSAAAERAAAKSAPSRVDEAPARPTRDLFNFGDGESALPATQPSAAAAATVAATPAAEPPLRVRLVGFVRTQRQLKAVLAVEGLINVLGSGEKADGFRVLELDEDAARVRLRTPEGDEIDATLAPR